MTSYSPISNSEIDTESPLTESLFFRLRDNPEAIREGDPTAPKIATAALADGAVTSAKIAAGAVMTGNIALETILGGAGGDIAAGTITAYNMAPAASDYLIESDGGYARLVSGLLLQWVQVPSLPNRADTTIPWKTPYLSSVAMVMASTSISNESIEATNAIQVINDYTLTQVHVKNQDVHGSGVSVTGWVFSIGI